MSGLTINLSELKIEHILGIPLFVLFLFGSGFLFLWAHNQFSFNYDIIPTIIASISLSPVLMIILFFPSVYMFRHEFGNDKMVRIESKTEISNLLAFSAMLFSVSYAFAILGVKYGNWSRFIDNYISINVFLWVLGIICLFTWNNKKGRKNKSRKK